MPSSCCVENCLNNAKSQPKLNFYILPSDGVDCKQLVGYCKVFALLTG